jgi:hypothetical protein
VTNECAPSAALVHAAGQVLYNPNDMEPHVALQIIEKIVRLMQPAAAEAAAQVSAGAEGGYEKNQKPDDKVRRVVVCLRVWCDGRR